IGVLCVIGLVAGGALGVQTSGRKGSSDPAIAWLPHETQLVLRVRYADMRGSDLFRRLMTTRPVFRDELSYVDRAAAAAGLDPARDLDKALIGTDGKPKGHSVAVLSG